MMETVNILGVHVNKYTMDEAVDNADKLLDTEGVSMIFTPNSEIILYASNNKEFTDVINSADMIIFIGEKIKAQKEKVAPSFP